VKLRLTSSFIVCIFRATQYST